MSTLAAEMGVSEVTVRRYLDQMERMGLLGRFHGGAILPQAMVPDVSFSEKVTSHLEEKRRVADAAARLVRNGLSVALGCGTTVAAVAQAISGRQDLTIVTNAVNVAWEFARRPGCRLMVTGGQLRESSYALIGRAAEHALRDVFVDIAFVGVNGISPVHGFSTPNQEEAIIHRALLSRASRRVVVADHTKWGRVAFAQIAPVTEVTTVITDGKAPVQMVEQLQRAGIEVILA